MSRFDEISSYVKYDINNNGFIEQEEVYLKQKEILSRFIDAYNPAKILKVGLGRGKLLLDLAEMSAAEIYVVEPSFDIIKEFKDKNAKVLSGYKIHFFCADLGFLPIDYYKMDFAILFDYLEFIDSASVIDELRRVLNFESKLLVGSVVLNDKDIEGFLDDFERELFALHNDFYISNDLNTVLKLNDFSMLKNEKFLYEDNFLKRKDFFDNDFSGDKKVALDFLKENVNIFKDFYNFNNDKLSLPYFFGLYMKNKFEEIDGELKK